MKQAGLYKEAAASVSGEIRSGRVMLDVPDRLLLKLKEVGGGRYDDASREDSSIITSLLKCGLTPSDAYATFSASPRGRDAITRKNSHFDDYLQRTIRSS